LAGRAIDLSEQGDELIVRFGYHPTLVDVVRGISRRRFDRVAKYWVCPSEVVVEVVETLVAHGFVVSAKVRALYGERGGKALGAEEGGGGVPEGVDGGGASLFTDRARPAAASPMASGSVAAPASLTVSELNARVRRALARAFPELLWIVGEIAGFDRNRHRAHVHFQLLEKEAEVAGAAELGTNGRGAIRASVDAVLFERTRRALEKKLAEGDAPFELKDGLEVRLQVRVDLYEPKGAYQLVVEDVDPIHTLGKIAQNRAAVLAELDKRGLREKNSSLPWPEVPLRVGLITSVGSDAYNDFVNELARSGFAFEITVADARMQGQGLERGLVAAIDWFNARAAEFDALAIVRGGGAKGDLMWFDNLKVALAVATSPIKVVSGIGHQRDVSVIDLIAHGEKTPTAAAAAIVARVQAFEERLSDAFARLASAVGARVADERGELTRRARELELATRSLARMERTRLRGLLGRLGPATRERLRAARRAVIDARARLMALGRAQARLQARALAALRTRLDPAMLAVHLERSAAKLASLEQLAQSLHPKRTLQRGFAIVRDAEGRTLRDATKIGRGGEITASLARGRLRARVESSEPS
jgi:exodeoxyribonuclease VII large subunit